MSNLCLGYLQASWWPSLTFNDHISSSCSKATRQLNAFARISKYSNLDLRRALRQNFILNNFNYSPIVWHFCGKTNNKKLEKIQERSLRILYNDYDSTYEDLQSSTLLLSRLKILLLETFKSLRHTDVECLHDIFNPKMSPYVTWGPQILCNRKGTQPLTGYDRSRISDLDFGIIWLMIFHFYVILITTVLRNL